MGPLPGDSLYLPRGAQRSGPLRPSVEVARRRTKGQRMKRRTSDSNGHGRRARALLAFAFLLAAGAAAGSPPGGTVLVKGGTFRMGTDAAALPELKRRYAVSFPGVFEDEVPAHLATVSGFRLDRTEVTNTRFAEFVAARPEWSRARLPARPHDGHCLEHWTDGKPPAAKADHPVVYVTWHAAQAFCRWAGGRRPGHQAGDALTPPAWRGRAPRRDRPRWRAARRPAAPPRPCAGAPSPA